MAAGPADVVRFIGRNSKRIGISVAGGLLVVAGLAMLVLPGPGILVVAVGFAVLGTEYAWATAAMERTKRAAERAGQATKAGVANAGRTANKAVRTAGRRARRAGRS